METTLKPKEATALLRRLAVVDMLRGVALMLLSLGCVLLWFHREARFPGLPSGAGLWATRMIAETGAWSLILVMGMNAFFLKKYHFSADRFPVLFLTFGVFMIFQTLFFANIFLDPTGKLTVHMAFPTLLLGILFGVGWFAGYALRHRMLLDAEDYAIYMRRPHDFRKVMLVFGQSPLFFFLTMLLFTQVLAWATAFSAGFRLQDFDWRISANLGLPQSFGYNLPRVYLTWFCILAVMYPVCRHYTKLKDLHQYRWMRFL